MIIVNGETVDITVKGTNAVTVAGNTTNIEVIGATGATGPQGDPGTPAAARKILVFELNLNDFGSSTLSYSQGVDTGIITFGGFQISFENPILTDSYILYSFDVRGITSTDVFNLGIINVGLLQVSTTSLQTVTLTVEIITP